MISIITGRPGSGKTYILAKKAKEFLKQGLQVYANFHLNYQGDNLHYFHEFTDLLSVKNGIIIIDEAQIYLNCRLWDRLDPQFQYKLQQHRKHGLDIWGAVQHINRIDVVMRELVAKYYEVKKLGPSEKPGGELPSRIWGLFIMREYDPLDATKKRRSAFGTALILMKREICEFYDTMKDLGFKEAEEDVISVKMKVCPKCGARKLLK